ncbi:ImmA/IrrE family metallo-endopeptidase [Niameybacter massiliensis]|uniref:ImmA/IrrE family metallo-endopeptidase n=1 Tax=Niameybacter massiliensis TaxID=1658108 RepID=UPI0006B63F6C|nr:ImmA/IrrE family metallo-endopeptidase [Niameybacter massiliensis]
MINIRVRVKNLVQKYGTRSPEKIAKELKIHVKYLPYATTKGYFIKILRNKFIIVNSNLDETAQQIVLAHELGHALLHSNKTDFLKYEKGVLLTQDEDLFNSNCMYENQANKFAAELLLHNDMEFEGSYIDETTYNMLVRIKETKIR